jgi:hypothetical protein
MPERRGVGTLGAVYVAVEITTSLRGREGKGKEGEGRGGKEREVKGLLNNLQNRRIEDLSGRRVHSDYRAGEDPV